MIKSAHVLCRHLLLKISHQHLSLWSAVREAKVSGRKYLSHVSCTYTCGKCPESAISAGVRISAYYEFSRHGKSMFRQNLVADTFPDIKEIRDALLFYPLPYAFLQRCGIFVI